jgi:hypothetical protein
MPELVWRSIRIATLECPHSLIGSRTRGLALRSPGVREVLQYHCLVRVRSFPPFFHRVIAQRCTAVWPLVVRRGGRNQQRDWLREVLPPLT